MSELATAEPVRLDTPDLFYRAQIKDQDGDPVDLTSATLKQLVFRHPDFPTVPDEVEAAVISTKAGQTDPVNGWVEFKDGDPATKTTAVGQWRYWARATIGTDGPFPSGILIYCVAAEGDDT